MLTQAISARLVQAKMACANDEAAIEAPMPHARPNLVLFIAEQQRFDTIGALNAPHMHTPHLDRLAL